MWVFLHVPRKSILRNDKDINKDTFVTDVVFDDHVENEIIELFSK